MRQFSAIRNSLGIMVALFLLSFIWLEPVSLAYASTEKVSKPLEETVNLPKFIWFEAGLYRFEIT